MNQGQFRAALLDPAAAVPDGLIDPAGRPAGRRFAVYRNNVAVSLKEALEAAFPVVRKLVGEAFFGAMSGDFFRSHLPQTPVLSAYGDDFPEFLASFPPVAQLTYLPDVARLEVALRQSYHAAEATPLTMEDVTSLGPDALMDTRFGLAPALRLIRSLHPVHAIWAANTHGTPLPPDAGPEDVVVVRPGFDPLPHPLPGGGHDFIVALGRGEDLACAIAAAGPDFELSATLTLLIPGGALIRAEATQ